MPPRSASRVPKTPNKQTKTQRKRDNDRPGSVEIFALDVVGLVVDCRVRAVGLVLHRGLGWTENAQVFLRPFSTLVRGVPLAPIFTGAVAVPLVALERYGVDDLGIEREGQGLDKHDRSIAAEDVYDPCGTLGKLVELVDPSDQSVFVFQAPPVAPALMLLRWLLLRLVRPLLEIPTRRLPRLTPEDLLFAWLGVPARCLRRLLLLRSDLLRFLW